MSEAWAERQRRTNRLIRGIAAHVLASEPDGDQLFGLCRLTWITSPYDGDNPAYIRSTKIPGLADALGINLDGLTLPEVAKEVALTMGNPGATQLVLAHTGFTNFYKAYRKSARPWVQKNRLTLLDVFRRAMALASDEQGQSLTALIAALPPIPKANHPEQGMRPEFLVTPVCFALDSRIRYPIINGAKTVRTVLRRLGATDGNTVSQYQALVGLIGRGGISDAADLDQLDLADLTDLLSREDEPLRHLLHEQPEHGDELPSKEEAEIARLQQALTIDQRRLHNRMTNQLRRTLADRTLLEGRSPDCRYDVLVRKYDDDGNDLLIEVKSSIDSSQVRMAIGQVLSYWHRLKGQSDDAHVAILLPTRPDARTQELLDWLEIGLLWFDGERLFTSTDWLYQVAERIDEW